VARKREQQVYTDARVAHAERYNLANLKDDEAFLSFYMECLRTRSLWISPISTFSNAVPVQPILHSPQARDLDRPEVLHLPALVPAEPGQRPLLSAIDAVQGRDREKIRQLEERIARLEAGKKQEHS